MSFLGAALGGLGGGAIGSAVVTLALDTTRYSGQLAAAEGKTASATTSMSGKTTAASGAMAGAYAAAGIAAAAFAASSVQAAAEHEQVLAALQQQVGENTSAFEAQATALQNLTGFQDEAILSADTILARFKLTDAQVRQSIPAILDYARATGKEVPESANLIGKALLGNARALKTIGINFTATGNTAADFASIMDLVNQKVGGQAAAFAETYAGKMEILSAKFDDLKEAVGGPLIDELAQVADALGDVADIAGHLNEVLPGSSTAFKALTGDLNPLIGLLHYSESAINAVHDATVGDTEATDELTNASILFADAMAGVADATDVGTAASKAHAQALRDEHAAEQQLAGGLTGLIADMNSLNTAQQEVTKLRRQGKEGTQEYRTATLAALEAQRTFNGDLAEQAQTMRENDVPLRNIIDRLYGVGTAAGLTRDDIRGLIDDTNGFSDAMRTLRERTSSPIKITVDTSGLSAAAQQVSTLEGRLARLGGI